MMKTRRMTEMGKKCVFPFPFLHPSLFPTRDVRFAGRIFLSSPRQLVPIHTSVAQHIKKVLVPE